MTEDNEVITGRVEDWHVHQGFGEEYIIWGVIYDDIHQRWPNGTKPFHTSGILEADFPSEEVKEGDVVRTRNSIYVLGVAK